jgi:hypothetical protein
VKYFAAVECKVLWQHRQQLTVNVYASLYEAAYPGVSAVQQAGRWLNALPLSLISLLCYPPSV